jgi:hypothetical protein
VQVALRRRAIGSATDDCEHGAVGRARVECDAHAVARRLAGEDRQAATVERRQVRQPVNAQAVGVPLGDDRDVGGLPPTMSP